MNLARKTILSALFLTAMLFAGSSARAFPPTYGAEFEFVNHDLLNYPPSSKPVDQQTSDERAGFSEKRTIELKAFHAMGNYMLSTCPKINCTVELVRGKWGGAPEYRVQFPNGFWFQVSYDPGVLEVQTKPQTLTELKRNRVLLQEALFDSAKKVGLKPDESGGAGHFNFGALSAFGDDSELFLKFFVDFANHSQLSAGALGRDYYNAPLLSQLDESSRKALQKIISDFRNGQLKSIPEIVTRIENDVYTKVPQMPGDSGTYHYQAFGLKKLNPHRWGSKFPGEDAPAELRGVFAQRNADEFIRIAELIENRIRFLKKHPELPLAYFEESRPDFDSKSIVNRFYKYVTESGGDWARFQPLLRDDLKHIRPSPFLLGKMTYNATYDLASVQEFFPDIENSKFIRQRLFTLLTRPDAAQSPKAQGIIRALTERMKKSKNPGEARAIHSLTLSVLRAPAWIKNTQWRDLQRLRISEEFNTLACVRAELLAEVRQ